MSKNTKNRWIKINLPYGSIYNNKTFEELDSFSGRGLNSPGTLIKTEDNEIYLIGHINELRGVCDDCVMFDKDMKIKAYKVIWKE